MASSRRGRENEGACLWGGRAERAVPGQAHSAVRIVVRALAAAHQRAQLVGGLLEGHRAAVVAGEQRPARGAVLLHNAPRQQLRGPLQVNRDPRLH